MTIQNWKSLSVGAAVTALVIFMATKVIAVAPTPYKVICHHNPSQDVTLSFQNERAYNGHLGTPHNDEVYDTEGACEQPTNEPTATPSPTLVQPSPTPVDECDQDECVEVTPTPTLEITPTPTGVPQSTSNEVVELRSNTTSTPSCAALEPDYVHDIWWEQGTPGDSKGILHWGTNTNYSKVHIVYGFSAGDIRYSLLNTDNDGVEEIGGLDNTRHYWFSVGNVNSCAVSDYVVWRDPSA